MLLQKKHLQTLREKLKPWNIQLLQDEEQLEFISGENKLKVQVIPPSLKKAGPEFPIDVLVHHPEKIIGVVLSKLKLNRTVFARNCEVKKISKKEAEQFIDAYHFMNSTGSAYNYGLFLKDELLAVASFSKGRKMQRLNENQRSFELIRFCSRYGITVTGGLSKLLKHFCREKDPGDVMTYVDKQFSAGEAFLKAGFKKLGETAPQQFAIDSETYERIRLNEGERIKPGHLLFQNQGNLKLVFVPAN